MYTSIWHVGHANCRIFRVILQNEKVSRIPHCTPLLAHQHLQLSSFFMSDKAGFTHSPSLNLCYMRPSHVHCEPIISLLIFSPGSSPITTRSSQIHQLHRSQQSHQAAPAPGLHRGRLCPRCSHASSIIFHCLSIAQSQEGVLVRSQWLNTLDMSPVYHRTGCRDNILGSIHTYGTIQATN